MTLLELCEPLFLYVCMLNRSARKGGRIDFRQARGEIENIFADMRAKASRQPGLSGELEKVELPLIFFVDSMIAESELPFAKEWHEKRMAYERNELAGDQKFFDIFEATMQERGELADQRLAVLYTCLGLGFTGMYVGEPEYLRSQMMDASVRLRGVIDADEAARMCPEAYQSVDTRDLIEPPAAKLVGIVIAGAVLVAVMLTSLVVAYRIAGNAMHDDLRSIVTLAGGGEAGGEVSP